MMQVLFKTFWIWYTCWPWNMTAFQYLPLVPLQHKNLRYLFITIPLLPTYLLQHLFGSKLQDSRSWTELIRDNMPHASTFRVIPKWYYSHMVSADVGALVQLSFCFHNVHIKSTICKIKWKKKYTDTILTVHSLKNPCMLLFNCQHLWLTYICIDHLDVYAMAMLVLHKTFPSIGRNNYKKIQIYGSYNTH